MALSRIAQSYLDWRYPKCDGTHIRPGQTWTVQSNNHAIIDKVSRKWWFQSGPKWTAHGRIVTGNTHVHWVWGSGGLSAVAEDGYEDINLIKLVPSSL